MGIMLNEDCAHFLVSRRNIIEQVDENYLKSFINQYANTDVTDFVMNVSSTLSSIPSKTFQFAADKYYAKEEMGQEVDYTEDVFIFPSHYIWHKKNIDMYKIWIDHCRYVGINPWFSFRMNNAEAPYGNEPHAHLSEYYYEHYDEYARIRHRERINDRDLCRDYGIEDFRNYMLSYIEETINNYDVYGIELDFMREYLCFKLGYEEEGIEQLTSFMERIKAIVTNSEIKYGHKIKISVRCVNDPLTALEFGFDIINWARLGLIDLVIPSPNWITTDNDIPINLWQRVLAPYNVDVIGCIECNINCNHDYIETIIKREFGWWLERHSFETFCGSAVNILSQTPNKIYLFNHMDNPENEIAPKELQRTKEEYTAIINNGSSLEKLMRMTRRHIVSYNDTPLPWKKYDSAFPIVFGENKEAKCIKINTGIVPEDMSCTLRLGMTAAKTEEVYCNTVKIKCSSKQTCEKPVLTDSDLYCFEIPNSALKKQYQIIEIFTTETTIDYADIIITKKSIE